MGEYTVAFSEAGGRWSFEIAREGRRFAWGEDYGSLAEAQREASAMWAETFGAGLNFEGAPYFAGMEG